MKEVKEMNKVLYENNEEVVMTKKWVKGQVIMSMPESLKKITNPKRMTLTIQVHPMQHQKQAEIY